MAGGEEERKGNDLYAVLGLAKECSSTELRDAYKKLAMRWHPDRCSASGNSKSVEEAKQKFQDIQEAYSVLSDQNKRLLYDVGIYDEDDDGSNNGMGDFLNEMTAMMCQSKPSGNGESFEELQELFKEIFQRDIDAFAATSSSVAPCPSSLSPSFHSHAACAEALNSNNKRNSSHMNHGLGSSSSTSSFSASFHSFCVGAERHEDLRRDTAGARERANSKRRSSSRKLKVQSSHNVSPNDLGENLTHPQPM